MKPQILFYLSCLFCIVNSSAQTPSPIFLSAENSIQTEVRELYLTEVKDAWAIKLSPELQHKVLTEKPNTLELQIPINDNSSIDINASKNNIFDTNFYVSNSGEGGEEIFDYEEGLHYFGEVNNQSPSLAAISIFEDNIIGIVSFNGQNYNIEKVKSLSRRLNEEIYIIYPDSKLSQPFNFECGADNIHLPKGVNIDMNTSSNHRSSMPVVSVYIDCDFEMYKTNGSDITNTTNYTTGLFNVVSGIFANAGVSLNISQIVVWSTQDPFGTTEPGGDSSSTFEKWACNTSVFNGRIAHLLSTTFRNDGGIATKPNTAFCPNAEQSWGYSNIDNYYDSNLSIYSWDVNVFAHELGHQLGSCHTHDCVWNGNNTPIDDCGPVYSGDITSCNASSIIPTDGTIMSYCHLGGAGVDLSLGFHPQVATLLNNFANNCMDPVVCPVPNRSLQSVTNITSTSAVLNCALTAGVSSYRWLYQVSNSNNWVDLGTTSTNSYTLTGLTPGESYEFSVMTICNSGGNSVFACLVSFDTKDPLCPPTLNLTGTQNYSYKTEQARFSITSDEVISGTSDVTYQAGDYVELSSNFVATQDSKFLAHIVPCFGPIGPTPNPSVSQDDEMETLGIHLDEKDLDAIEKIVFMDINGKVVLTIKNPKNDFLEMQNQLSPGLFFVEIHKQNRTEYSKITIP